MKNIIMYIVITCSLSFVGCAQKSIEPVKNVINNFLEALKSGDSNRTIGYVIEEDMNDKLIEALVCQDKKYWDEVKFGAFQICVEEDEAVVVVPCEREDKTVYFSFYMKYLDREGSWKISSFLGGARRILCTIKGYKDAKKEFDKREAEKSDETKIMKVQSDVRVFKAAISHYYIVNRKYPKTLEDLTVGEKGTALLDGGETVLADPWGNKYEIKVQKRKVSVVSAGPDGLFGTEDDINL